MSLHSCTVANKWRRKRHRCSWCTMSLPVFEPKGQIIPDAIDVYAKAQEFYMLNGSSENTQQFHQFMLHDVGRVGNLILTPDEDNGRKMYAVNGWRWSGPDIEYNFNLPRFTRIR